MYSFYGGQKGQDFRITHIFPNRSEGLLKDLQARWYSPINVGDYVFINYGDIAQLGETIVDSDGTVHEIETTYNKNLIIDLLNCGKSYTNSIWQKIYVDENKEISPDFPDSEENVYIFINFEDDEPEIKEEHNIVNNETYDKDFRLYFNGTAYLNGELIDNGFKVSEVGKYTLDLIGKDGIQKKYSFFIEDNSLKNKDITDNKTVSIKENNINTQETDINIGVNQIPYEQKEDFINKDYLMLIPVIIFTATLLCLFKIKQVII